MTTTEARDKAKARLDIDSTDSTFDSKLVAFATDAVDRIPPHAYLEVAPQTVNTTPDSYGQSTVTLSGLSTPLDDVRRVEASNGSGSFYVKHFIHAGKLYVRELPSDVSSLLVYGLKAYAITELPAMFNMGVVYYMMADFYAYLVGNKRAYNAYMQNGRPAVDNMQDLADYYEQKAMDFIQEKGQLYGG